MNPSLSLRLSQLRAELEASYESTQGLSVLYAIRRELLRHDQQLPPAQLAICSLPQLQQLDQMRVELTTPPAFPALSTSREYSATERALVLLERVLSLPS